MTLVGLTALSVEIITIAATPCAGQASATIARADRVGQHAFDRIGLDQRHMLERGGVEHQFGP